jgi:hypothetical protein
VQLHARPELALNGRVDLAKAISRQQSDQLIRRGTQTAASGTHLIFLRLGVLLLLAACMVSFLSSSLHADDRYADRQSVASTDQSPAAQGSTVRWRIVDPGVAPSQVSTVRQAPSASPAGVKTPATSVAMPKSLFSHARWGEPAEAAPRGSDPQGNNVFCNGQQPALLPGFGVVQTNAEMPLKKVQPISLPSPSRKGIGDDPDPTPLQPPTAEPPLPIRLDPSTAPASPTLQQQLAAPPNLTEKCSSPRDLKSIRAITADISVKPADLAGSRRLPPECPLGDTPFKPRDWHSITFAWTAAGTCHNPVYFEDEQLERYGHSWGPVKQTAVSAVRFFATVPLLPYYMGVYPPNECIYDLGQYRPGSCAPYYLDPLPLSVRGALYEGMFLGVLPAL